ncbi:hypothetical protein [Granulicella tundricola]|uniref:Uncharacterized protein n=1 Tax=Granulicella tundricola (strain ATCC BAA-1859 / DSM 23138 / MP5ACTX9) TaxID=1198114 RepID=E8WZI2_GRATM|nr:hypothetical protein [Granulicella tundricola]ADW68870.1 hypothetical protein AciX9_1823 [Granulicella tundricola MP5ACTX9]
MLKLLPLLLLILTPPLHAQHPDNALSEGEVEKLRESAPEPAARVLLFSAFLDQRAKEILTLTTGRRHAGREEDIHDQLEQFSSIANDLEDNLEDYAPRHKDLRKSIPKLLAATDRWQTAVKTPPDHDAYNVSRRLALEAITDLREDLTKLLEDQKAYFQLHPPNKENKQDSKPE